MNRKSKIIVSVVGITIVLLALLGITYAYYLTRIEGNTNSNSISVTTADLRLVYGDGNGIITKNDIMPGTTIGEKTFTVKNTGKTKINDYAVTLEYAFIENVIPSIFERPNDFEITLTCNSTKEDGTTGTCNGFTGKFNNENIIMTSNAIESEEIHNYSLTIYYANPNEDQSNDMGKNLNLIVNIARLSETADVIGEITGVDETHSVKLNSEPKISSIIKNEEEKYIYKFKGVPLGTHTLTVLNADGEITGFHKIVVESGETATTGTKEITYVEDGETVTATVPSITIKEEKRVANITTTVNTSSSTVSTTGSGITDCEYYPTGNELLRTAIINNAKANKNGTSYSPTPLTTPAEEISGEDEATLSIAEDDGKEGISYYFRGNVQDNYVNFANMCWRIVRIDGNNNIKLILEDQYTECDDTIEKDKNNDGIVYTGNWNIGKGNYGWELKNGDSDSSYDWIMNYLMPVTNSASSMVKAFYDFQTTKLADYTGKLKSGDWCLEDKAYTRSGSSGSYTYTLLEEYNYTKKMYYDAYTRVRSGNANGYQPTLKCNGTILNNFQNVTSGDTTITSEAPMYVSAITADEIVYAGGHGNDLNYNYYLMNNSSKDRYNFWTLSPNNFASGDDFAFNVSISGHLGANNVGSNVSFRPSVSLASSAVISSGEGTIGNPYVIN